MKRSERSTVVYLVILNHPEATEWQWAQTREVAEQLEQAAKFRHQFLKTEIREIKVATTKAGICAFAKALMERRL